MVRLALEREQALVTQRNEGTAQGGVDMERIIRPLDRGEHGAHGDDLLARMKRASTREHMRYASRFEGSHVLAGHVVVEGAEALEQQTDMACLHRHVAPRLLHHVAAA